MRSAKKWALLSASAVVTALSGGSAFGALNLIAGPGYSTTGGFSSPTFSPPTPGYPSGPGLSLAVGGTEIGTGTFYNSSGGSVGNRGYVFNSTTPPGTPVILQSLANNSAGNPAGTGGRAINNTGMIIGAGALASGAGNAGAVWNASDGSLVSQLPALIAGTDFSVQAYSINDSGTGTGTDSANSSGLVNAAVRWTMTSPSSYTATALDALGSRSTNGQSNSQGTAINNLGTIVGFSSRYNGATGIGNRAAVWAPGGTAVAELPAFDSNLQGSYTTSKGTFGGTLVTGANVLNANNVVGGNAQQYDSSGNALGQFAVRWYPNGSGGYAIQKLDTAGTAPGPASPNNFPTTGNVFGLNAAADAVGNLTNYDGSGNSLGTLPALWKGGNGTSTALTPLALLGTSGTGTSAGDAISINDGQYSVGDVQGWSAYNGSTAGVSQAVLWAPDGSVTLIGSLVNPSNFVALNNGTTAGYTTLNRAETITNDGWISGYGTYYDPSFPGSHVYLREFLIQDTAAVPEPASVAVVMTVATALSLRRRRSACVA